jgi:hypothetical protein
VKTMRLGVDGGCMVGGGGEGGRCILGGRIEGGLSCGLRKRERRLLSR